MKRTRIPWLLAALCLGASLAAPSAGAGGYRHHGYGWHGGARFHGHGHDGAYLALGIFTGTLLGYAIGRSHEDAYYRDYGVYRDYGYYRYYPRWRAYRYPDYPTYRPPAGRVVYVQPAPSPPPPARGPCLQEREYQTVITIDGEPVEAWGTACLQPDGSWRRGGLNIAPSSP